MKYNREQSEAALSEFGFRLVDLNQPGAPTPGRIADRISDIHCALADAIKAQDWGLVQEAFLNLRRLLLALDSYDGGMQSKRVPT